MTTNAILNITFQGLSADIPGGLDFRTEDVDVRRIAVEILRSGSIPGWELPTLDGSTFDNFIVDRFDTPGGGKRLFLRPKVPFGA